MMTQICNYVYTFKGEGGIGCAITNISDISEADLLKLISHKKSSLHPLALGALIYGRYWEYAILGSCTLFSVILKFEVFKSYSFHGKRIIWLLLCKNYTNYL